MCPWVIHTKPQDAASEDGPQREGQELRGYEIIKGQQPGKCVIPHSPVVLMQNKDGRRVEVIGQDTIKYFCGEESSQEAVT